MLGFVPLHRELVGCSHDETPFVQGDRLGRLKPGTDGVVWKFAVRLIEDALPCIFSGQLHRCSKTVGDFSRARDVTSRLWKSQCGLDKRKKGRLVKQRKRGGRQGGS